jgi:hypothetical protein
MDDDATLALEEPDFPNNFFFVLDASFFTLRETELLVLVTLCESLSAPDIGERGTPFRLACSLLRNFENRLAGIFHVGFSFATAAMTSFCDTSGTLDCPYNNI